MAVLDKDQSLEVVYYPTPVPLDLTSLTPLGLFFDRIHFPNVYLPTSGYDFGATRAEFERIQALEGRRDVGTAVLLQAMRLLPVANVLREFCNFTGAGDLFGKTADPRLTAVVDELEILVFGPRPDGFMPIHSTVAHKGLPGGAHHFEYPDTFYYPATALAYAADHGLPLLNDQPGMPVPSVGGEVSAKNNERLLSTILAVQCAGLVLPNIQPLHPLQIVELRNELKPYLRPFRRSLLQLSKDLNGQIEASSSEEEIRAAAEFLMRTSVVPQLEELRAAIAHPEKPWYSWAFGAVKYAPSLSAAYASVPLALAAGTLTAVCDVLVNVAEARRKKQSLAKSGMYFLLKLKELGKKAS